MTEDKQQKTDFIHLHVHTHYSLLDGMCKIPELLDKAKEMGMDSLAITDHGVMYGAIEFYKEAKKKDIKPLIGFEGYIAPRKLTDKTPRIDGKPGHIILLAKNLEGYKNLMKLTTIAHLDGYYYKPRIDKELLKENSKGLVALSGCASGEIARNISEGNFEGAKKAALEFKEIFEEGDFYLEMQYVQKEFPVQAKINEGLKKLSKELNLPLVVTSDVHYIEKDDGEAQDVLLCLQTGSLKDDENRMKMSGNWSLLSQEEITNQFKDTPEAIENTLKVAEKCNLEIELGKYQLPDFTVPKGETVKGFLEKLVWDGIGKKYGKVTSEIKDRTEYELSVVEKMGFPSYFLIVWDFVKWAKDQGIVVGPGRGSAAGSIVAYALDITEIDPLKYGLLFERFLNPERISMPDIDMDFADDRRGEVIEYVAEKYGSDHVAQIITFGTMKARNAIRDTGRVLGFSYGEVDKIAKMIPDVLNIKLKDALVMSPDLKAIYRDDANIKHLIDIAMKLEGVSRHSSTHAAGVIISKDPLIEHSPLQRATKGDIAVNTQYEMHAIEDLGLLKMDFLGLSNLTIIKNVLRIIKKVYDKEIDINNLPVDDKKTYGLLARGETTGIFQFESTGMKKYLKDLKPTNFEDITAMGALYRPGPLNSGMVAEFIDRKHGRKKTSYPHPIMEKALKNTYGVIVYQEQVIQLSKDMAGFTGGEADNLRKAVGKKIAKLMKEQKIKFIEGCLKNNLSKKLAEDTFTSIEKFAEYGFNKSHAACYAFISYQTAYLKAYFPAAFMAALMTSNYGNIDQIAIDIDECGKMGIEVLPPDVNESFAEFAVVKETGKIRFGMKAIKNVGMGIIKAIILAREEGGKFKNTIDFIKRVNAKEINKKVMEALIKCGAFDSIGERNDLLFNMEKILNFANKIQKENLSGQTDLFSGNGIEIKEIYFEKPNRKLGKREMLDWEKELLGVYISDHPLKDLMPLLEKEKVVKCSEFEGISEGKEIKVGGIIASVQKVYTRNKEMMYFARLEDTLSSIELVVFPKVLAKYPTRIRKGNIVIVSGKFNTKDGAPKLLVDTVKELSEKGLDELPDVVSFADEAVDIIVPEYSNKEDLENLKKLLVLHKGENETFVIISDEGNRKKIKLPFGVDYNENLKKEINGLFLR